ncbi:MAG: hypothetical protein ACTHU0_20415 [Kofleriaceae bacterium]
MELDAFSSRLGVSQGRVRRSTSSPAEDRWAFVLGDDQAGYYAELGVGDGAEVAQDVDLTGLALVHAQVTFRAPAGMPTALAWQVSLTVDGVRHGTTTAASGRTRVLGDLAANVSKLSGVHRVGVRLELVSA